MSVTSLVIGIVVAVVGLVFFLAVRWLRGWLGAGGGLIFSVSRPCSDHPRFVRNQGRTGIK